MARAAMQVSRVIAILSGAALIGLAHLVSTAFGWTAVFVLQVVPLAAGAALIRVSAALFRRDLIFERR